MHGSQLQMACYCMLPEPELLQEALTHQAVLAVSGSQQRALINLS
jgi:hypothetical protein